MANPTSQEIDEIVNGQNQAQNAADYADTVKMEMQLISEENYQMVWTVTYTGPFVPG